MKTIIANARVIDPGNHRDEVASVYVADNKLVAIADDLADFTADEMVDAANKIVMPGVIDLYSNLPEPGYEYKATIASEARAAMHAGITTVCCAPATKPVIDTTAVVELINSRTKTANGANILLYGALTKDLAGQQLSNMAALKNAGCVAMSNAHVPIADSKLLRHCFEYAATFDLTVVILAQDAFLVKEGLVHEGRVSARTGLVGIPRIAESIDVARAIHLAEFTQTKLHFTQITTVESVELIAAAKAKGLSVTCDVSINHLFLTEVDVSEYDTNCFIIPPLRDFKDQQALISGLQKGTIDAICSAHTPHEINAKRCPFNEASPGIGSLEVLIPLSFRLVLQGKLSVNAWVACLTSQPASIVQPSLGCLQVAKSANFIIFDPQKEFIFELSGMLSEANNIPYHHWPMQGSVERVFFDMSA